jgi:hypothetical protein
MRSLFRSFERFGLEYLLISGQAAVLYGAATFSEDIDLWIRPTARNVRRLLQALAARHARVYKLTPPLTRRYWNAGHGFHFLVPGRPVPAYIDILAHPPRVEDFLTCRGRSSLVETDWGRVPVVSVADLVLLKKTRRLSDYEVISNLVLLRVAGNASPSRKLLLWAARNSFRAEDRARFLGDLGRPVAVDDCRRAIAREIASLQARDAAYWRQRTEELRRLRSAGKLLRDGMKVAALLS